MEALSKHFVLMLGKGINSVTMKVEMPIMQAKEVIDIWKLIQVRHLINW